jgi:hypothetical protein
MFVDEGAIVRTRGRQGDLLDESRAMPGGAWSKVPLVVLVNKASASASEVVAGALQDHRRALIVGERTYGKGSVQAPFELGDGSVLKLTISLYYTPADRLIQASGIQPDVLVGTTLPNYRDSLPELDPERAHPRHLKPENFGYPAVPQDDESEAVRATGADAQLQGRGPAPALAHLAAVARRTSRLMRERGSEVSLALWCVAAGGLFLAAPRPPEPPGTTAEEEAIFQRTVDQTVEKTRRWQAERGDWTIPWDEAEGHMAILIDDVGRELHLLGAAAGAEVPAQLQRPAGRRLCPRRPAPPARRPAAPPRRAAAPAL